jgi:hypothetical protein
MNVDHPIERVPATPEYILACFREEWRQCALPDGENEAGKDPQLPAFETTIHEWREALDLVWWSPLGQGLNKLWGTKFSERRWFSVLVPAREKTLRGVCELLASEARRPLVPATRLLGRNCESAAVFLAIRSLLVQAGAAPDLRPSTPLQPFLRKWPKVFLQEVSRLAPGGLPFRFENTYLHLLTGLSLILGCLLLLLTALVEEPWLIIGGVFLFAAGWIVGLVGGTYFPGRLILGNVATFRGLTEAIVAQQRRYGFAPKIE